MTSCENVLVTHLVRELRLAEVGRDDQPTEASTQWPQVLEISIGEYEVVHEALDVAVHSEKHFVELGHPANANHVARCQPFGGGSTGRRERKLALLTQRAPGNIQTANTPEWCI
jgi:hypothetical protein